MTPKQKAFIKFYLSDECYGNATEAARRAGYKGADHTLAQIGYENLRKPDIKNAIEDREQEMFAGLDDSVEAVLIDLQRLGKKAEADRHWTAAIGAARDRGRYLKMFTDKIEQIGKSIEDITDDELRAQIRADCEELGIDPEPIIEGYFGSDPAITSPGGSQTTH